MTAKTNLARTRLDERLATLRTRRDQLAVPRGGWAKAIRSALGMTLADLAASMGITRGVLSRLEGSEQKQTIQLDSLQRLADAMDCDLVYALVPREPLQAMVERQRDRAARELEARTRTHMRLEDQDEKDPSLADWRKEHSASLISDRRLWKNWKKRK